MYQRQISLLRYGFSLALIGLVVCFGWNMPASLARAYQNGNLLQNPGFEEDYVTFDNNPALRIARHWQPWYVERDDSDSTGINARPEYKLAPANRVHSGVKAQEYNTFFATHTGGVYQRVPVVANTELHFSIYVYIWSSATFANPNVSEDPNDVSVAIGIDPTGGTDGTSSNIVWSAETEFYDEYRELSVAVTAQGPAVTVFVRTISQGFVGVNNVYLDTAALVPLGTVPPTAPPSLPIATATATATLADIIIPTQEGTVTPVPVTPTMTPSVTPNIPSPTPTPKLPDNFTESITYTVVAGDTVWDIAQRFGSTAPAITQLNGLNSAGLINVGQVLIIPLKNPQYVPPPTFTPPPTQLAGAGGGTGSNPTPVAQPSAGTYTVLGGDTLYEIARRLNTTVATLAQMNNIVNPNLIFPGQVITVAGVAPPVAPATPVTPPVQGPRTHTVRLGENLFRISLQYNVAWDALARVNGITNPSLIFPGQILTIP